MSFHKVKRFPEEKYIRPDFHTKAVVLTLFSESKVQMKIESIENLNFDKKEPRKFAKISTHKYPDLVSKL